MKKTPVILIAVLIIAIAALVALPAGAQADPCDDPDTRPDWCTHDPTPLPTRAPLPTPDLSPYPAPDPGPYPAPATQSKPWRLFNLTAIQWSQLTPAQRLPYWRSR